MENLKLPPHIILDKDGYYYSTNTDRYISPKNIKDICEKYWENEEKEVITKTVTLNEVEQLPVKEVSKYPPQMFEPTNWEKK